MLGTSPLSFLSVNLAYPRYAYSHTYNAPLDSHHQSPWSFIAFATLTNLIVVSTQITVPSAHALRGTHPAILLPATSDGSSPSFGVTYVLAVCKPFSKQSFMIIFKRPSTSSLVHLILALFCAISKPDTATPPQLAAFYVIVSTHFTPVARTEIEGKGVSLTPGAYQIPSPCFFSFLTFSNLSIASCSHPILLPSAMYLHFCLINASASSPLTSFCVAHGNATSTSPT